MQILFCLLFAHVCFFCCARAAGSCTIFLFCLFLQNNNNAILKSIVHYVSLHTFFSHQNTWFAYKFRIDSPCVFSIRSAFYGYRLIIGLNLLIETMVSYWDLQHTGSFLFFVFFKGVIVLSTYSSSKYSGGKVVSKKPKEEAVRDINRACRTKISFLDSLQNYHLNDIWAYDAG